MRSPQSLLSRKGLKAVVSILERSGINLDTLMISTPTRVRVAPMLARARSKGEKAKPEV